MKTIKETALTVGQLHPGLLSKAQDIVNSVFFRLVPRDLNNPAAGAAITAFLLAAKKRKINCKVVNSLPACIFSPSDKKKAEKLNIPGTCLDCGRLIGMTTYGHQALFCNGARDRFMDEYYGKSEFYKRFLKSHLRSKIPKVCANCDRKASCSYGCIYRGKTPPSFGMEQRARPAAAVADLRPPALGKKAAFRNQRIFCFPSYICNNNCRYCFVGDKRALREPDFSFLEKMIKEEAAEFPWINFGGGEPTVYPRIAELVKLAVRSGLKVQLFTNGRRLADRDFTASLLDAGVETITEVLHSHKPEVHDFITRRQGSFSQMVEGIANLHALNFSGLHLILVVHKFNYRSIKRTVEFALSLRPRDISFEAIVLRGNAAENFADMAVPLSKISPPLETAFDILIDRKFDFHATSLPFCLFSGKYWKYFLNARYWYSAVNFPPVAGRGRYMIRNSGHRLSPRCLDCQLKRYCPGTFGAYYSFFGDKEFSPQRLTAEKALLVGAADILQGLQTKRGGARKADFIVKSQKDL